MFEKKHTKRTTYGARISPEPATIELIPMPRARKTVGYSSPENRYITAKLPAIPNFPIYAIIAINNGCSRNFIFHFC